VPFLADSDVDAAPGTRERSGGRVVVWLLLGLLVVFGGLYAAAHYAAGDKVPRGTTVSGVRIGGHPQEEAADRLQAGLAEQVSTPVQATVDGTPVTVEPTEAGLGVDYEASVAEAGGEASWDPVRLWNYFTGGDDLDAVVTVDDAALAALVTRLDAEHGRAPREGALVFEGAGFTETQPRTGRALDAAATGEALADAWLAGDTADLQLVDQDPAIDAGDLAEARSSFANAAVSGPVTLTFEGSSVRLQPADYTAALSMEPVEGELVPRLDEDVLSATLEDSVAVDGAPVDATVALVDGRPRVVPAKPGVTFDPAQVTEAFLALVAAPADQRSMTVKSTVARPDFTTKEARALGVEERVSTFTTYFPYAEYRNINIGRAAELVDGTLLKPGETFSLNDTVGERTRENGFTEGYIISDGILVSDLGGGVSQMATTTFNAMFFAGLEDVEHKPHSFYIDRYPIGREATVAWGAVDLRFRNDTPYGVLVSAKVTPATAASSGVVTVSMYSTKYWNITTSTGERHNITEPEVRRIGTRQCHANEGYGGFDIDVTRYFEPVGANTETRAPEVFSTTYTPSDTVICTNPAAEDNIS
jgi:vancomycin resistance protein YoaR